MKNYKKRVIRSVPISNHKKGTGDLYEWADPISLATALVVGVAPAFGTSHCP